MSSVQQRKQLGSAIKEENWLTREGWRWVGEDKTISTRHRGEDGDNGGIQCSPMCEREDFICLAMDGLMGAASVSARLT